MTALQGVVTLLLGLTAGLAAALAQSASYLFSRDFITKGRGSIPALFIMSHVIMGVISLAILPLALPLTVTPFRDFAQPLFGAVLAYMAAQCVLFAALRSTEPSRIAPLLGLKIIVLALIVMIVGQESLGPLRWIAVILCAGAALLLNEAGGRLPARVIAGLCLTVTGYALSDFNIVMLVHALASSGRFAPFIGVCYSYLLGGIISLPFLFFFRPVTRMPWRSALPYAASWYVSMIFLYICFALIGVVFGNIVQSTRGLISIVLAVMVARMGFTHIETHVSPGIFWKRIVAALLMLGAIALYTVGAAPNAP